MAVAFDAASSGSVAGSTSVASSHTTGAGSYRAMLAGVSHVSGQVTSVLNGAVAMTRLGIVQNGAARVALYGLIGPAAGASTVTASLSLSQDAVIGVVTCTGVDPINGLGPYLGANGSDAAPRISIKQLASAFVLDVVAMAAAGGLIGPGGSQTLRWQLSEAALDGGGSSRIFTGLTAMTWSAAVAAAWAIAAVQLQPAGTAPGAENVAAPERTHIIKPRRRVADAGGFV